MFYPCRKKEDLLIEDSHWKKINSERMKWSQKEETMFLIEGFDILQHIDDRLILSSQVSRERDPVTLRRPLQDLELSGDVNYEYCVEKQGLIEEEHNLPDLWR